MKREDLRPVEYKKYIEMGHNGQKLVAKYADPVNGWFHGWEKQTDAQPSEYMQAVIELEDGSIHTVNKREFRFKEKQHVKNHHLRPILVTSLDISQLNKSYNFTLKEQVDQGGKTEDYSEESEGKSILDAAYVKTKAWFHKIIDNGGILVEYEDGKLSIERAQDVTFTD